MRGFLLALMFLTRLPVPPVAADDAAFAASMRWFPAAGLVIGAIVAGAGWLGGRIDPWAGALTALVAWVAVTGALHLDGLADLADASGAAHKDRARLLAVLADPHVGSFGVVAIALQLVAKLVLLHAAVVREAWPAIALIPAAARIGPLVWTLVLPPLHEGLAARFRGAIGWGSVALWGAVLAAAAMTIAPGLLLAAPLMAGWGWWLRARIGGISGDGHGGGIEVVEAALLLAILL